MITASVLFVGSMQLLVIGITGEYLGRVYGEVKGRPLYIVASSNIRRLSGDKPDAPTEETGR